MYVLAYKYLSLVVVLSLSYDGYGKRLVNMAELTNNALKGKVCSEITNFVWTECFLIGQYLRGKLSK